jgi:hypothetical protein
LLAAFFIRATGPVGASEAYSSAVQTRCVTSLVTLPQKMWEEEEEEEEEEEAYLAAC